MATERGSAVSLHDGGQRQLSRFCSFSIERKADGALIRLAGELDLSCEDPMHAEVARVTESCPRAVVIDLGDVTFIDSPGLRMLLDLASTSRRDDFELTLIGADRQVRRSIRITGLDRLLPLGEPLGEIRR
jgi:anti-sigma B factor antagonist